ncbi:hypothetical protein LIER_13892 [Lithospermum erythrorhizon]|uniref:Uncharacterized protein n=1 Tax=Lithospermum erythrorhizon TaxID=34254 RepID=A0AAV3PX11_LITER
MERVTELGPGPQAAHEVSRLWRQAVLDPPLFQYFLSISFCSVMTFSIILGGLHVPGPGGRQLSLPPTCPKAGGGVDQGAHQGG